MGFLTLRYVSVGLVLMPALGQAGSYDAAAANTDATATINMVQPYAGSSEALNSNLAGPTVNNSKMTAFNGTQFDGSISCALQNPFMELFVTLSSTGDISSLSVTQDTNFDGTMDASYSIPASISGVCANGVISCTPGTWSNCLSYAWDTDSAGLLSLLSVPSSKLGGCYCINNHCGSNLVMSNLKSVLSNLGGGALSAHIARNASLAISDVRFDGPIIRYFSKKLGGCTSPSSASPVSYLKNPVTLSGAGAEAATSNDVFKLIQSSPAGTNNIAVTNTCTIDRVLALDEASPDDVITFSTGAGIWSSCGSGCSNLAVSVGSTSCSSNGAHTYGCHTGLFSSRPDRILSATLTTSTKGYSQVAVNGTAVWNGKSGSWTSLTDDPPDLSCQAPGYWWWHKGDEYRADLWTDGPIDLKPSFTTSGPYDLLFRAGLANSCVNKVCFNWHWGGNAKGWDCRSRGLPAAAEAAFSLQFSVDTACRLGSETINDTCATYASNPDCNLESETVDGVTTFANYNPTRLSPMVSTQTVDGKYCSLSFSREWWHKSRSYKCKSAPATFDFSNAMERKAHIETTSTASGYEDYRLTATSSGNVWSKEAGTMVSAPMTDLSSCTQACKTRKPRTAGDVSQSGIVGDARTTPAAFDYVFHECQKAVCPLASGEEIVKNCSCINDFAEAATLMQTLRMAGKDVLCTSGSATPLK